MLEPPKILWILPVVSEGILTHWKLGGEIDRYRPVSYSENTYFLRELTF